MENIPPPSLKPPEQEPDLSRNVSINSFDADQIARINGTMSHTGKYGVQTTTTSYPEEMDEIGGRLGTIHEYVVREH